ncbi:hypothetical protein V8F06_009900 [Rhypophila decipiens]
MLRYTVSILALAALVASGNCRQGEIYCGSSLRDIAVHDNYDAQIREAMAADGYSDPTWDQMNNALFYIRWRCRKSHHDYHVQPPLLRQRPYKRRVQKNISTTSREMKIGSGDRLRVRLEVNQTRCGGIEDMILLHLKLSAEENNLVANHEQL